MEEPAGGARESVVLHWCKLRGLCLLLFPEALKMFAQNALLLFQQKVLSFRFKFSALHVVLTHFRLHCRFTNIGFHKSRYFEESFNYFCPYNEMYTAVDPIEFHCRDYNHKKNIFNGRKSDCEQPWGE